jgi:hypothetical protein
MITFFTTREVVKITPETCPMWEISIFGILNEINPRN